MPSASNLPCPRTSGRSRSDSGQLEGAILNLSTLTFFDLDDRIADLALRMVPEYASEGLGSRDCAILATMKLSGVRKIATHDQAFAAIDGIEVFDAIPRRGA